MGSKKKSVSESLVELINPAPLSFDPEDDIYTDTVAKIVDKDDSFSEEEALLSTFRKRNLDLIEEEDERYSGAKVSRKALKIEDGEDSESEFNEEVSSEAVNSSSDNEDELGEDHFDSEEETAKESEKGEGNSEDETTFQHFSNKAVETEVEKGNAVRTQLNFWDNLLQCRILLQKSLSAANKFPQYNTYKHFKSQGGRKFRTEVQRTKQSLITLLNTFIKFQTVMLKSYPETKNILKEKKDEDSSKEKDEEINSDTEEDENYSKVDDDDDGNDVSDGDKSELGKLVECDMSKNHSLKYYDQLISERHKKYTDYRNATIQKWNDKTRISTGKLSNRNFSSFEQSTVKQIEQILSNRPRLIQRSQLKRSSYNILGHDIDQQMQQQEQTEEEPASSSANTEQEQTKEYNTEIYDDTDFYQQLLRELIERKASDVTDPIQLGRQWLELQKLRSKMKRKIDTRATKGRKIRYVVHPKLVNFMAPVPENRWSEEAKTELFNSLFGNNKT